MAPLLLRTSASVPIVNRVPAFCARMRGVTVHVCTRVKTRIFESSRAHHRKANRFVPFFHIFAVQVTMVLDCDDAHLPSAVIGDHNRIAQVSVYVFVCT